MNCYYIGHKNVYLPAKKKTGPMHGCKLDREDFYLSRIWPKLNIFSVSGHIHYCYITPPTSSMYNKL